MATDYYSPVVAAMDATNPVTQYLNLANMFVVTSGPIVVANPAANETVTLFRLPPGNIALLFGSAYMHIDAIGASTNVDMGHTAYRTIEGASVAADVDAFLNNTSTAGEQNFTPGSALADVGRIWRANTVTGFDVTLTFLGTPANSDIKIEGFLPFAKF